MSSFFEQIIEKIFPAKITANQPLVREVLQRSIKDQANYKIWLDSSFQKEMIKKISKAYFYKKANISSELQVHLFNAHGANGFAITYHQDFEVKSFQHLLDYFKDLILRLNYRLQIADRQMTDKGSYVETIDKYYLKPYIKEDAMEAKICNQLFGNVLLEHVSIDNKPSYIKILVTTYNDYSFTKALDFDEFTEILLNNE